MSESERRKAPRHRTDIALEVFDADGQLIVGVGRLSDVSILGGRFASRAVLEKGRQVRVLFRVGEEQTLDLTARIIWVEKKGTASTYGISFVSPSASELRDLELWMARNPRSVHEGVRCPTCQRPL